MPKRYDAIILGAGPAGLTAAIYLGRNRLEPLVVDTGSAGGQMVLSYVVANYPGVETASGRDFAFIEQEKGMFSFLGLTAEQAVRLREEFSVYMLNSSRINVAGVNARNLDYFAQSVAKVL